MACIHGYSNIASLLFQAGSKFGRDDHGNNLNYWASVQSGHIERVEMYLSCGVDVNSKNPLSQTALHLVIKSVNL